MTSEGIEKAIAYFDHMRKFAASVLDSGYGSRTSENKQVYVDQENNAALAIYALIRQQAKEPDDVDLEYNLFVCPNCKNTISYMNEPQEYRYCMLCGQKIDWKE